MIELLEHLFNGLALGLLLLTVPGTVALIIYSINGTCTLDFDSSAFKPTALKLAILIPAHNEANNISTTITSLNDCKGHHSDATVIVIADNCSDETAQVAKREACRVIERTNKDQRGKGYALAYAFDQLKPEAFDAYIVVDADTSVEPNFIAAMERPLQTGAHGAQCRYVVDPEQKGTRAMLMAIAFMLFNVLRARARAHADQSVGIMGNGFALTRESLQQVPYDARSIVEDLEHHLDMVLADQKVRYVHDTKVWSSMPSDHDSAAPQRARWEGGRFNLLRTRAPQLLAKMIRGRLQLWEPLMELSTLPLSYHTLLQIPALIASSWWINALGLLGLMVIFIYVMAGMIVGEASKQHLIALLKAPFFIAWKLSITARIFHSSKPQSQWQRTSRKNPSNKQQHQQSRDLISNRTQTPHRDNNLDEPKQPDQ